ncbi:unnamed protein product [Trifolium pratense]|uniref:Uncharacterized protein n=1 Tax=Trifolium pratense TaxID=57577 RepID=A0ACB0K792_TRIPR|nr:unnamed protein product [Trifolium pratense]
MKGKPIACVFMFKFKLLLIRNRGIVVLNLCINVWSCKLSETRIGRPFNGLEELGELIASLFASLVVIDTLSFVKFGSVLKPVDASEVRALMLSKFWFCDCGFELQEARTSGTTQ